jgi:NAD(P)-dependent dehydrogenase (short-subunit alcohol dehydrogenase family)
LAREGASIVAFDICEQLSTMLAPGATEQDLQETMRLVEAQDQRCLSAKVDARDLNALRQLADRAMGEFGRVDIILGNHGCWHVAETSWDLEEEAWNETIDVMLTGGWKVCKAFIPKILKGERGGSIVVTASISGLTVQPGAIHYCAAKAGQLHMTRVLAWELGKYGVRVNAVAPGSIRTPMVEGGAVERAAELHPDYITNNRNRLPITWQPAQSISDAIVFVCSDEAAFVTGATLPVDAGGSIY